MCIGGGATSSKLDNPESLQKKNNAHKNYLKKWSENTYNSYMNISDKPISTDTH